MFCPPSTAALHGPRSASQFLPGLCISLTLRGTHHTCVTCQQAGKEFKQANYKKGLQLAEADPENSERGGRDT